MLSFRLNFSFFSVTRQMNDCKSNPMHIYYSVCACGELLVWCMYTNLFNIYCIYAMPQRSSTRTLSNVRNAQIYQQLVDINLKTLRILVAPPRNMSQPVSAVVVGVEIVSRLLLPGIAAVAVVVVDAVDAAATNFCFCSAVCLWPSAVHLWFTLYGTFNFFFPLFSLCVRIIPFLFAWKPIENDRLGECYDLYILILWVCLCVCCEPNG